MVFQCINIRQVPWEVLKTSAFGLGFQHLPRDLVNVNALKTTFDPYIKYGLEKMNRFSATFTKDLVFCLASYFPANQALSEEICSTKKGRSQWLSRMRVRLLFRKSWVRSPPGPTMFCRRYGSGNICYGHSVPFADSRRIDVSFWRKNAHKYWFSSERTKSAQEKCGKVKWPTQHDPSSLTGP